MTTFNGTKFRSRLEARWAVFFELCRIKYEYEPYRASVRIGYRPDFGLGYRNEPHKLNSNLRDCASYAYDYTVIVEIKPSAPTGEEKTKLERYCTKLHQVSRASRLSPVQGLLLAGPPNSFKLYSTQPVACGDILTDQDPCSLRTSTSKLRRRNLNRIIEATNCSLDISGLDLVQLAEFATRYKFQTGT